MMIFRDLTASFVCICVLAGPALAQDDKGPIIGQSEQVYSLAPENENVRGLAIDDSAAVPRLFVLDGSKKLFIYQIPPQVKAKNAPLMLVKTHDLRKNNQLRSLRGLRGLAFAKEAGEDVLYFINWEKLRPGDKNVDVAENPDRVRSQLWKYNLAKETSTSVDLNLCAFKMGNREAMALACRGGELFIAFDAAGLSDRNLRVRRGIVRLKTAGAPGNIEFAQHLADSGIEPAQGLACMKFEGAAYLWGTVGNRQIYCADAASGRGLFFFERPKSSEKGEPAFGLCFGNRSLWVPEGLPGADCVHRVNVTKNLDVACAGPPILRRLVMNIQTAPENPSNHPGRVFHNYSRPYENAAAPCQGIWPETEKISDVSGAGNANVNEFFVDPAGDVSSRQQFRSVEYADAPSRAYASQYEISMWTCAFRRFVYPHRVDTNVGPLRGTNYLADDADLYNLRDKRTYEDFIRRVAAHIAAKYDTPANMKNPYWAARNILEYVQDTYYYPDRDKAKPATVDYARKHYDANPGNLKIELSNHAYDASQIIACSGTSVMLAGALRHLGIPARWVGTGTQKGPASWDANKNGLLDADEAAPCSNGHRYTHVWLGSHYGWIAFDGTPSKPDFGDYDPPPPHQSQWRYMTRIGMGESGGKRIIFNLGSELLRPLYHDYEYDAKLAVDNNCGGDQRYNLQGRFEKPELWKNAGQQIALKNICFVEDITVDGPMNQTVVRWRLTGDWNLDPHAALEISLQRIAPGTHRGRHVAVLAANVPSQNKTLAVDLSPYAGETYRIAVRKVGDAETGGYSPPFKIAAP